MTDFIDQHAVLSRLTFIREVHREQRVTRVRSETGWETIDVLLTRLIEELDTKDA